MSHVSSTSILSDTASPTCTLSNHARTCDTYTLGASGAHGTAHPQPQEAHQGERALHAHQACEQQARDYTHREGCEYMDDIQACDSLRAVGLGYLLERFGEAEEREDWERILSPGEQQRLIFARLLLRRPAFAVLDESTSALTQEAEREMYAMCAAHGITTISVGHRESLRALHPHVLEMQHGGQWLVSHRNQSPSTSVP
eukprot:CAMPEP_0179407196 /NCGR_PEP_ID=MMETSP0799-20121207/1349_1 /TAXON_ID=46947 /ORGANISM="Geminigera cryophila, Strain CCMP2564" /LENGTH=199 /DNA_ID=CAMNT_0021178411 /DNA_START=282 /DNA_END=881 /DNA_ORIENTATION=+